MVLFLQSNRKRKQVTYVEDDHKSDDNDAPFHKYGQNDSSEAAADMDMAGQDTQCSLAHHGTSELDSNQMHTEPGTTEDISEDLGAFELHDHLTDSTPKDYLFTGGGFCTEEGDEQDRAGDATGAELEHVTDDAFGCIDGISDSGRTMSMSAAGVCSEDANMETQGASSSQLRKAVRGLSAMPTLTKRRRNS
jgi:DNA excision repair protein ERCC-5